MGFVVRAFGELRLKIGRPKPPYAQDPFFSEEFVQIGVADGLQALQDGPKVCCDPPEETVVITDEMVDQKHLWVVREDDVVNAEERCDYAARLPRAKIKHTNLTGGAPAYTAGEIIFLGNGYVVINGCSGRYGPRTRQEMSDIEEAFTVAGYGVWSTGFDDETLKPVRFHELPPQWVDAK